MYFLYDIALFLATPMILVYCLYSSWRKGWRREGIAERFGIYDAGMLSALDGQKTIWVHAVSVGETIAVMPLLKGLKAEFPERKIVLSNGTETGHKVALTLNEADLCIYFPFDFRFAVRRLLELIHPSLILVVETEIWPNFLRTAREMGIPVVMVNGRISDRSFGSYLRLRWFFSRILSDYACFCMQTCEDARRIVAMGAPPDRVEVTKNLKYDLPVASFSPTEKQDIRSSFHIPPGVSVVTTGSTHEGEDETVISVYRRLLAEGKELFLILAPRHPERVPQVAELLRREGVPFTLRSKLDGRCGLFRAGELLLVDTVGELMRFYTVSDVAFVGGSLVPTGGHNVLEPASLRVPVLFGPHMNNFRESASLILAYGGGLQVRDGEELATVLGTLLDDEAKRRAMGDSGARLMEENSGSTLLHLRVVECLLEGH